MEHERSLFSFVGQFSTELAELAYRIEEQLLKQPHAAMLQIRVYSEQLVKLISTEEMIEEVYPVKHSERIQKLYRKQIIEEDLYMKLEWIRKKGNKAAHDVAEVEVQDVLQAHKHLFDISVWYTQVYVSYSFEPPVYRVPIKEATSISEENLDILFQPYVEGALQEINDMRAEIQRELETLKKGQGRIQKQEKPASNGYDAMDAVLQQVEDIFNQQGFELVHITSKAAEFTNKCSGEIIYLLTNKELTIVVHPNTVQKDVIVANGKEVRSTALRKFPKKIHTGATPISYGHAVKFKTAQELAVFLSELHGIVASE